ncbi:MAG: hypothetical protein ACE37D_14235 [Pseudomonadales bacterium]
MVRMLIQDTQRHPRLAEYVKKSLPEAVHDASVWNAFLDVSGLRNNESLAKKLLRSDHDQAPLLRLKSLNNIQPGVYANGQFNSDYPNWIILDQTIATRFESDFQRQEARLLVQSTLLHELVHWSEIHLRGHFAKEEMGKKFERAAYGRDIDRYWIEPERAPKLINALDADLGRVTNETKSAFSQNSLVFKPYVPRGIRNNNPGNIRISENNWEGLATEEQKLEVHKGESQFEVFRTPAFGISAMGKLFNTYASTHGLTTIREVISRWAPESDGNNTESYITYVAKELGLSTEDSFPRDRGTLATAVAAMIEMENGVQPYGDTIIHNGLEMAGYV